MSWPRRLTEGGRTRLCGVSSGTERLKDQHPRLGSPRWSYWLVGLRRRPGNDDREAKGKELNGWRVEVQPEIQKSVAKAE